MADRPDGPYRRVVGTFFAAYDSGVPNDSVKADFQPRIPLRRSVWRRTRQAHDRIALVPGAAAFARRSLLASTLLVACVLCGCGSLFTAPPAPLFGVHLSVNDQPVGTALIDTGGGFEVLLREEFGLNVVGNVEVLAFGGVEEVRMTEGFSYLAGGVAAEAQQGLVGLSTCQCNGLGFVFFRKTRTVLAIDFPGMQVGFLQRAPAEGVTIPFASPPEHLNGFETSFLEIEVSIEGKTVRLTGLADTGSNLTAVRAGALSLEGIGPSRRRRVTIGHDDLGVLQHQVVFFETEGLPDVILGTDIMRRWGDRWYFTYLPRGGNVTVVTDNGRVVSAARRNDE